MAIGAYVKDPNAVLDYTVDWADWLASGETIATVTWTVETGLTKDSNTNTNTTATVWLSGGTDGTKYTVACKIVTSASRTDERSFTINCKHR